MKNDQFADIAAGGVNIKGKGLEEIIPDKLDAPVLKFEDGLRPAVFGKKMTTKEELYQEVERQKKYYRTYMKKLAPPMKEFRKRKQLKEFQWRIAEKEDFSNFACVVNGGGQWENVTIPHFGGPLGVKTTFYRTVFQAEWEEESAVFLHFDGVDYIANVYVNGILAGSHEGFFAPFEFDITQYIVEGDNILVVEVKNDFVHKRSQDRPGGELTGGDKIYAATGPGYDDPDMGWHHCPPGMGIYQNVYLETRRRCFIQESFVRTIPEENRGELWLEIYKCDPGYEDICVEFSLYGRNFEQTVFEGQEYVPFTSCEVGMGDTFTEAQLTAENKIDKPVKLYMEKGINYLKIPFQLPEILRWTPKTPYLYEMQIFLKTAKGLYMDGKSQSFGIRSFHMDTDSIPKGMFYLNGEKIKLRGANTMGHEQQCVMKGDMDQLLTDLILAKVCNMNFLRLTQRPVQDEVYEYCDMIGLMTQTDLPLFGVLRKNKMTEVLRQTEEMAKLVRKHPCNIMVSYINEPFPNAYNQPHRHLSRAELMDFFDCADKVMKMYHPDQVIKHVDGDYDPPSKTLPDNHCYTCWYNGCGVEAGALHKGYWLPVKEGWNYGCGEFGAEGLDEESVMRKYYPKEWLPADTDEEYSWTPSRIQAAQTGNFYHFFYDTQHSVKDWIRESQRHQAWATKWMTEAFRRNRRMVSFAIHLFIDAFPAGWMKTIMDVDRNPKPAYFAYRDALTPAMVSLRTDRFSCYEGESIPVELWICNDMSYDTDGYHCYYEVLDENGRQKACGRTPVTVGACDSRCTGVIHVPTLDAGKNVTVRAALEDREGKTIHFNEIRMEVYERKEIHTDKKLVLLNEGGKAGQLVRECGLHAAVSAFTEKDSVILVDDPVLYEEQKERIDSLVAEGAKAVFLELEPGAYSIPSGEIKVQYSSMLPMNYVSPKTGHELAEGFRYRAFWNWYDSKEDMICPILESTVTGEGMKEILVSGNTDENGSWREAAAVAEFEYKKGKIIVCQLKLAGRTKENPAAAEFFQRLIK